MVTRQTQFDAMRIAFVTDTCLPEINGVTTVLATMARGLTARGHAVHTVAPAYPGDTPEPPDAGTFLPRPSVRCPGYGAVRLTVPFDPVVRASLRAFRPDVVHAVTEGPLGLQGRRFALKFGLPLVSSYHTDFPGYAERYLGRWAVGPTVRYLTWFHGAARATQTPSHVVAETLRARGLPRATVWGRSVDTLLFHPARRNLPLRRELGFGDRVVVLHVGRLAVEKDLDTLIASFQAAHVALGDAARFCVAGDGPEARALRQALPFATHFGFLDRPRLADLYANADLFVFPSPTETCGLVALEALASGLPVIGARAGGIVESVQDGITGRLVGAGDAAGFSDAIVELGRDTDRRRAMAVAGRAFAAGRTWDTELDTLEGDYRRLCQVSGVVREPLPERDLAVSES
jgi:glycosyltransferase involved in cell wall biosynthesis